MNKKNIIASALAFCLLPLSSVHANSDLSESLANYKPLETKCVDKLSVGDVSEIIEEGIPHEVLGDVHFRLLDAENVFVHYTDLSQNCGVWGNRLGIKAASSVGLPENDTYIAKEGDDPRRVGGYSMNMGDFDVPIVEKSEDLNSFQLRQMAEGYLTEAYLPGDSTERLFKRCEVVVDHNPELMNFEARGGHALLGHLFNTVSGAIKQGYGEAESYDGEKDVSTGGNYALADKLHKYAKEHFGEVNQLERFVTADITLLKDEPGKVKYAYFRLAPDEAKDSYSCEKINHRLGFAE
jgi:hypothetical protein